MKIGIKSLQDFAALLIRRKWWVIVPFVALFSVVTILAYHLPKVYVSEALILVPPREVSENFVMNLMTSSTEQRLKQIQQMVLSRDNVTSIIGEFNAKLPELGHLNMDEKVEKIRSQIDIKFGVEPNAAGVREVSSFRISYQHRDPKLAQEIAGKLTYLFIQQDLDARQDHVQGTTRFLTDELAKKDALLEESEKTLKALKSGNQNQLPAQLETNLRALDRLYQEKNANREALDRLQTAKLNVESILLTVQEFLPQPVVRLQQTVEEPEEKDPDLEKYLGAKTAYENLILAGGKPIYPDVLQAKRVMDLLKAKVPPDVLEASEKPKPPKAKPAPVNSQIAEDKKKNPHWVSLQNQMREIETETKLRLADKSRIEDNINNVNRRVEATPQVDLMLTDALRDNAELRKERDEINNSLTKAQLSQNLETNKPNNFHVVDKANFPLEAAKPNMLAVLLVGCLLSIALAMGVALVVDVARQRVWTQAEIEAMWGVPVMVDIPAIVTDSDQDDLRKKKLMFASLTLAFLFFYSVCLYGINLKHNYILQRLDPVLQKVVYR